VTASGLTSDRTIVYPDVEGATLLSDAHVVTAAQGGADLPDFGVYYLRDWKAKVTKVLAGTVTQAIVAWVGDSWTTQGNITTPLQVYLKNLLGDAGPGYVNANDATPAVTGVTRTVLGTWTHGSGITSSGAGMTDMTSTDTATPATLQFVATATDFVIHYLKQPNGGTFTWKIDGGGATSVNTANATTLFSTVSISGLSNASHTLLLTMTVAGAAGVTISGVDVQLSVAGARFHNCGFTGTSTVEWAGINAANWEGAMLALNPNVVGITLGVNDLGANLTPTAFKTNLTTIITRIRAVLPNCDIILASPSDIGITGTYTMSDYVTAMQQLAWSLGVGFCNHYKWIGDYTTANARGLYTNTTHVNATGGAAIANFIGLSMTPDLPFNTGAYFDYTGLAKGAVSIGTATISVLNVSGNLNPAATSYLQWSGRATFHTPGAGLMNLENYAADHGVQFDVITTDGTVIVRDRAGSAGQLAASSVRGTAVTFANRPATPVEGMLVAFTDSTTVVWGATITGTGANHVLGYYNGTNWTVAGK